MGLWVGFIYSQLSVKYFKPIHSWCWLLFSVKKTHKQDYFDISSAAYSLNSTSRSNFDTISQNDSLCPYPWTYFNKYLLIVFPTSIRYLIHLSYRNQHYFSLPKSSYCIQLDFVVTFEMLTLISRSLYF